MYVSYDKPFYHSSATELVKYVVVVDRRAGQKYGEWNNKISAMNDLNFHLAVSRDFKKIYCLY